MLPLAYLTWIGAVSGAELIGQRPTWRGKILTFTLALILMGGFTVDNIRRYLIHEEGTHFQNAKQARQFILDNSKEDDLLFGHVTTTPILALLTGRDIALDLVDTNHMRFKAGILSFDTVRQKLNEEERLKFFIIQQSRFWMDPQIQSYLTQFPVAAVFDEPRDRIIIYDCRPGDEQSPSR